MRGTVRISQYCCAVFWASETDPGALFMSIRILRLPAVKDRTGLSRSTIYGLIADGRFPRQFRLGPRAVGWREADIEHWIAARTTSTEADNDEAGMSVTAPCPRHVMLAASGDARGRRGHQGASPDLSRQPPLISQAGLPAELGPPPGSLNKPKNPMTRIRVPDAWALSPRDRELVSCSRRTLPLIPQNRGDIRGRHSQGRSAHRCRAWRQT